MAKKEPLRHRNVKTISSAGLAEVELEYVERGFLYCYQRVCWEISKATSGGNTRCRLVIKGRGYNVPLAEQDVPVADKLYWYKEPTWLYQGESICLIIDQAQADCVAEINGIGYFVPSEEGIV